MLVTTPCFAPDEALLRALCAAPRRGVNTTWIVGPSSRAAGGAVGSSVRMTWAPRRSKPVYFGGFPAFAAESKAGTALSASTVTEASISTP